WAFSTRFAKALGIASFAAGLASSRQGRAGFQASMLLRTRARRRSKNRLRKIAQPKILIRNSSESRVRLPEIQRSMESTRSPERAREKLRSGDREGSIPRPEESSRQARRYLSCR